MKILLIAEPKRQKLNFPPFGLLYIQSALLNSGYDCKFYNASVLTENEISSYINEYNPDFIGLSCWTVMRNNVYNFIKFIKEKFPRIKIIVGGQHASFFPEQLLKVGADYVFAGEGEKKIIEFLKVYSDENLIIKAGSISFVKNNGIFHIDKSYTISDKLDEIFYPSYVDVIKSDYTYINDSECRNMAGIISSRGCPYACSFCSSSHYWKRKINFRGVENIIGELVFLTKSLKYDKIIFYDDNFFINKNRLKIILNRIIDLNLNIKWMALSRVDNIDKEVIELCKKSGCFRLDFGIESGSQRLLNAVNKKITVEEILTAYHLCIENDICFRPYIILGLPGETIDTIDETILLMKKINCDYSNYFAINILWILPNTQIYFSLKNQNKINDDVWMNKEDIIYYTQEHSYEELLKLKNYFGFHIPNGLLFYCNKLIDALINSLNRCFKNKKVFIYGTGEIRELIYFNKEKLNIVLVEQISSADFVFAASINNGDKIKNRLKLEINIPVFTIQELNSEYNLDLNFNDLNFYVMLYKEFKNKIRYDIEYFNSRISGIFFYKTNFLYNIFKLILNDVKSVKFLLQTSDTSKIDNNSEAFITFNNLERVDYLPNDYYYSFGKKRIL